MLSIVVFEDAGYRNLLPLTYWRTAGELRTGYASLLEHIIIALNPTATTLYCRPGLAAVTAERHPLAVNRRPAGDSALFINARLLLTEPLLERPAAPAAVQWHDDTPIIIQADARLLDTLSPELLLDPAKTREALSAIPTHRFVDAPKLMNYPWNLVHANPALLRAGWERERAAAEQAYAQAKREAAGGANEEALGKARIYPGAHLLNEAYIHIGPGSVVKPGVVLDAEKGPIFIGAQVVISPNVTIEGPCYIGDGSLVQPGANLRDAMSIGRRCKVGGELESSIIHGYSNKQHDGFLGHSYVAEWVNLAADTVNSDLKNTYGPVRVAINGHDVDSGQQFVGLTIGDHSKSGIGQMFPTGAVVGFGSNVATCTFAPKFVPSFTWLTTSGAAPYEVERCLSVARKVMARRQVVITPNEETLFRSIAEWAAQTEHRPEPIC